MGRLKFEGGRLKLGGMNWAFFLETLRLGIHNLHLHKLRSFLTALGIIIGVAAVIGMLAIGEGAKRQTSKAVEQLGATNIIVRSVLPPETNRASSRRNFSLHYGLKRSDVETIREGASDGTLPYITMVVPMRETGLDVVRGEVKASAAAVGTSPDFLEVANLSVNAGRFLVEADMKESRTVAVLGAGAAQQLFGAKNALGQKISLQGTNIRSRLFEVVGVMNGVGLAGGKGVAMTGRDLNFDVYFPLTANEAYFGDTIMKFSSGSREMKVLQISDIYIRVTVPGAVEPTAAAIQRQLDVTHMEQVDFRLNIPRELLRQATESQAMFNWIMGGIAAASLLVGGIGIMNISLATVTERTREIGIRRALGAKRLHVIVQFLIETTCLSLAGGLIGVGCGIGLAVAVQMASQDRFPTYVSVWSVVTAFVISAVVGILSGIYPAIVAACKDPIEALRHD